LRAKVHKKFKPTKETAKTSTIIAIFSYFDANKRKSKKNYNLLLKKSKHTLHLFFKE
jgi:hypothetical protein